MYVYDIFLTERYIDVEYIAVSFSTQYDIIKSKIYECTYVKDQLIK